MSPTPLLLLRFRGDPGAGLPQDGGGQCPGGHAGRAAAGPAHPAQLQRLLLSVRSRIWEEISKQGSVGAFGPMR